MAEQVPTITVSKKAERPQRLWRVMTEGADPSEDAFYDTKEAADSALKKMGGKGAVAGIKFPAKSREEESALKEQYMQSVIGGKVATTQKPAETEEDRIKQKISEVNPQATEEQKTKFLETLSKSRARGRERGGYAEKYQAAVAEGRTPTAYEERRMAERASKAKAQQFFSDISARQASADQLNQYNKQLGALKSAYRNARRTGDYVEQYRLGEFINAYQAGIPKEIGAREKAARSGIIGQRNKEMQELARIEREAKIEAQRTSMANPDFVQFNNQLSAQYQYPINQLGSNLTFLEQ